MEALDVGSAGVGSDHSLDAIAGDDGRGRTGAPPHRDRETGRAEDVGKVLGHDDEEAVELMLLDERAKALLIDHGSATLFLTFVDRQTSVFDVTLILIILSRLASRSVVTGAVEATP